MINKAPTWACPRRSYATSADQRRSCLCSCTPPSICLSWRAYMHNARPSAARRRRFAVVAAPLLAAALAFTSACGDGGKATPAAGGKVDLTIGTFGEFGYKALYTE